MKTKLIAGCMAAVVAAGCLTYAAYDSGDVRAAYAATVDDLTITVYSDSATVAKCSPDAEGEVVIPSEYAGVPVTMIASGAFSGCEGITSVTVPDTIKSLPSGCFRNCTGLTSVKLPDTITSIPYSCFEGYRSLASINIPVGVKEIGWNAFEGCTALKELVIPYTVEEIGHYAFSGCSFDSVTIRNPYVYFDNFQANTIYGYPGSTAETYAKANGITFIALEGEPQVVTTTGTTTAPRYRETTTTNNYRPAATTTLKNSVQKSMLKYDVNGNGAVNIADAVLLARLVSEDSSAPYPKYGNPDVNSDGVLTVEDITIVLNALRPFSVQIGNAAAKPGAKVTVPVQIYGDKGTAGGQVYISYDSRLTPVSVTAGDAYAASIHSESAYYPIYIGWSTNDGMEQTAKDGAVLAYLEFTVDANIRQTEYLAVSVLNTAGQNSTRFSDSDGYVYSANCGSGFVTVIP